MIDIRFETLFTTWGISYRLSMLEGRRMKKNWGVMKCCIHFFDSIYSYIEYSGRLVKNYHFVFKSYNLVPLRQIKTWTQILVLAKTIVIRPLNLITAVFLKNINHFYTHFFSLILF